MRKLFIGFVFGCLLVAGIVYLVVLPEARESYRAVGFNDGSIAAKSEIAAKISSSLGMDLSAQEPKQILFDVKTTSVVVVERSGVKTLRVAE